jgi:hypothetical protein
VKRLAVLAGLALALPLAARAAPDPPLLGIVGSKILTQQLVQFDAGTLRPFGPTVALAAHRYGWSFSPDRRQIVLGGNPTTCARPTTLRLVDVTRMETLADVPIAASGPVRATAWLDASHVLAVVGAGPCASASQTRLVDVDLPGRRIVARTWVRGNLMTVAHAPGKLVLLLAPPGKIGSAKLAVVDASGQVRQKTLGGVSAGQRIPNGRYVAQTSSPGLAIDPAGGRALLVSGWDGVTDVDLRTLRVNYHPLSERTLAKSMNGSERSALWLGNGLLAVTGSDSVTRTTDSHPDVSTMPAGLKIVDTRTWTSRTLDPQVSSVRLAGGIMLAQGSSYAYDGSHTTSTFLGLVAYSRAGHELYRLFEGLPVGRTAVIAGRGYATVGGPTYRNRTVSFDLATGKIGRSLDQPLWELLLPA